RSRELRAAAMRCCLLDVALAAVFTLLVVLFSDTSADADLWGHIRFGSDLLATRQLSTHDPYSFTSDIAWVNHEWLAEAIEAGFYLAAGAIGLNVLKLSVIALIGVIVWRGYRTLADGRFAAGMLTAIVLLTTYTRTQVLRPQLFSVL